MACIPIESWHMYRLCLTLSQYALLTCWRLAWSRIVVFQGACTLILLAPQCTCWHLLGALRQVIYLPWQRQHCSW